MKKSPLLILVLFLVVLCFGGVGLADPLGTAFTYQGRLIDNNQPADGLYDLQFKLYDCDSNGNQLGEDVNLPDTPFNEGYFTVELDFGPVYDGNNRWIEIGVRPGDQNDPCEYTVLSSRQRITPAPYALNAITASADGGGGGAGWVISGNDMYFGISGNVGIGTTSPQAKLDVMGQIRIAGGSPGEGKVLTSDSSGLATWQNPSGSSGGMDLNGISGIVKASGGLASQAVEGTDYAGPHTKGSATVVIAAYNASDAMKKLADYVCDDVNDEVELNQAVDYLYSNWGGGKIQLSEGDFNGHFYIDEPNITLQGMGMWGGSRLRIPDNWTYQKQVLTAVSDYVTIRDLEIDGRRNYQNITGVPHSQTPRADGICIFGDYGTVERCYVHDCIGHGIIFVDSSTSQWDADAGGVSVTNARRYPQRPYNIGNTIRYCEVRNDGHWLVSNPPHSIDSAYHSRQTKFLYNKIVGDGNSAALWGSSALGMHSPMDCEFIGNEVNYTNNGVNLADISGNVIIAQNVFLNILGNTGVIRFSVDGGKATNTNVSENIFRDCNQVAIVIPTSATGTCITDNLFYDSDGARFVSIQGTSSSHIKNTWIERNRIRTGYGAYGVGIYVQYADNLFIKENDINSCGYGGISLIAVTNADISGNYYTNFTGSASYGAIYIGNPGLSNNYIAIHNETFDGNSAAYGVYINNTATDYNNISVHDCFFKNFTPSHIITGLNVNVLSVYDNRPRRDIPDRRIEWWWNASGATIPAGSTVIRYPDANGYSFTWTGAGNTSNVIGMTTELIFPGNWGRILTKGKTTILRVNGIENINVGDYLTLYSEPGILRRAHWGETDDACAIALQAYTADDSNGVITAIIIPLLRYY